MWISLICICGFRVGFILSIFKLDYFHKIEWLYSIYPVSWLICIAIDMFYYWHVLKKKTEEDAFRRSQASGSEKIYLKEMAEKGALKKAFAKQEKEAEG